MEVVEARAVTMTNYEVLRFLKEQREAAKADKKKKMKKQKALLTVTLETLSWLEASPAGCQEEHQV